MTVDRSTAALFSPLRIHDVLLANRIAMAPMTRSSSPHGVPGADVAEYYRLRAAGGVGLIITEGTFVPHPAAGFDPKVPRMFGDPERAGWREVVRQVHAVGSRIFSQLWHVGLMILPGQKPVPGVRPVGPSGFVRPDHKIAEPMTQQDIEEAIEAYGKAAQAAKEIGFDGIEINASHGYLIDQFFRAETNLRTDRYGGEIAGRTRFAVEVVQEIRRQAGPDCPLVLRFSQWKINDYSAKMVSSPNELEKFLNPLTEAGIDAYHCSTRRFWEAEFPASNLNLAGWTKKLSGKPTITVGSVSLGKDVTETVASAEVAAPTGIDELLDRLEREEFDLIAIGRSLIANPDWALKVRDGGVSELRAFIEAC